MSNTLTLTIPAGTTKFAVAYACQTVTGSGASQTTFIFQDVIEAATLDGTSFSEICRTTLQSSTGTLTGVDASAIPGANYWHHRWPRHTGRSLLSFRRFFEFQFGDVGRHGSGCG